ncbi:hypothetical protein [Brachybacterium sp. YJGR34]|uniref:pectate lyase family protein n=1 Tax=Brachybacterium sp. YJGR34 TaxID=2059911 RepID=UPI001300726C|nr:hypothetical protein [Brachybacterium sp. YJGR34]
MSGTGFLGSVLATAPAQAAGVGTAPAPAAPAGAAGEPVASTWFETAHATWSGDVDAEFAVHVRGRDIVDWRDGSAITGWLEDWTLVNDAQNAPLVRVVDPARGTWRADVLGLPQGTYEIQVRDAGGSVLHTVTGLRTTAFPRLGAAFLPSDEGYGFAGSTDVALEGTVGGYLPDGRLDPSADVVYVTHESMDQALAGPSRGEPDVVSSREGAAGHRTPLVIRFLGTVGSFETVDRNIERSGSVVPPVCDSNNRMLKLGSGSGNITFEGVGPDAVINGWGLNTGGASNLVIRNLRFDNNYGKALEINGGGFDLRASNLWIDHNTFGVGQNRHLFLGHDPDNAKGDGSTDIGNSARHYTVSANHYAGSSKAMLIGGNAAEMDPHYGTITGNWFHGSEERTPRVRGGRIHVAGNLYQDIQGHANHNSLLERNTGYGIGAGHNATIWAEGNIFDNVNFPFLRSRQGHARGFQAIDYQPGPEETESANAGLNQFFGDQPGFVLTREVVTDGDFPDSVEGFRRPSDVMTDGSASITEESLEQLRQALLALQPNIIHDTGSTHFDPQLDIGAVVAEGSTTTNPEMTPTGGDVLPAQLDWVFRPSVEHAVDPTESPEAVEELRARIEGTAGRQAAGAPGEAPVAPTITGLAVNEEVLGANALIAVHGGTFTLEWQDDDALTGEHELQVDRGDGEWSALATIPRGADPTRFVTQAIDQFARVKEGEPAWVRATNGLIYRFRVRAVNTAGASPWSEAHRYDTVAAATATATVEQLAGKENALTITVTEEYVDGTSGERTETVRIRNNAEGTYRVGSNDVFVDTEDNTAVVAIEVTRG